MYSLKPLNALEAKYKPSSIIYVCTKLYLIKPIIRKPKNILSLD